MTNLEATFLEILESAIGKPEPLIPLHEPEFNERAWSYVKDCLDSTFVSSVGQYVDQFEARLAEFTGANHAIAVANGTAALQISLLLAGVTPKSEVLVPALSFVATANAVSHCGAIPHFIDSNLATLGIDPESLNAYLQQITQRDTKGLKNKITDRYITAIVPMHTYGHSVDMEYLQNLAQDYQLPIVEDAAEALGSYYQGKHAGTLGQLGILSFNGNKIITTGGGGAILTHDSKLAHQAKHLTTTAKQPHRWEFFHDQVAWNYRLPNLNAALGCAQLEQLPELLQRKRQLALKYQAALENIEELTFICEPESTRSNYWLNTVRLTKASYTVRNQLLRVVNDAGYQCRPTWTLLNKLPMYANCPSAPLPIAEQLEASLINIPSSAKLLDPTN